MQQIKIKHTNTKKQAIQVNEGSVNLVDSSHHTPASGNEQTAKKDLLTYTQLKECRALAFLEYTSLSQTYEQFSLRIADNLLVKNNAHLDSILGLLAAEIASIQTVLFAKEKKEPEHLTSQETNYLRSLLRIS